MLVWVVRGLGGNRWLERRRLGVREDGIEGIGVVDAGGKNGVGIELEGSYRGCMSDGVEND